MDVLQVAHGFPPSSQAGTEVYARALSLALQRAGARVSVFHRVADPGRAEHAVESAVVEGLPVTRINNTFRAARSFEDVYRSAPIDRAFGRALDEARPDVVHFHHLTCLSTGLVAEAVRRRVPVVYTLHDYWLICQRGQFLRRDLSLCDGQEDGACARCLGWQLDLRGGTRLAAAALRRRLDGGGPTRAAAVRRLARAAHGVYASLFFARQGCARAQVRRRMEAVRAACAGVDAFLAPSRFLMERYREFGIPAGRLRFWPYGFERGVEVERVPRGEGPVRFGYIGTWMPPKGLHVLVEAFDGLDPRRARLHVHGHPVGYPEHEDYLERVRARARSPAIHFEGPYDNRQVGALLAGLDVVVTPSIWFENAPLTVQEAMMAGLPVVASDLGGMKELVRDGVNGLLFRPRDPSDLRAALQRFVDDPDLCRRLRPDAAGVRAIDDDARAHLDLYAALVAGRA
jgi:glycosyltransferase involved in cell wall biosynthesis